MPNQTIDMDQLKGNCPVDLPPEELETRHLKKLESIKESPA